MGRTCFSKGRGQIYEAKGDYQSAINTYQAAIRYKTIDYSFYIQLGNVYLANSAYSDAVHSFDTVIQKARCRFCLSQHATEAGSATLKSRRHSDQ
jgi:tetratricopeptide (TPR) repeat protein